MTAWLVLVGARHINTVFFDHGCDADYVRDSLIKHDGYSNRIWVVKRK
jgi:hypothetical protein